MSTAAATIASTVLFPAFFLFHGGGPLPLLNDPGSRELVQSWTDILQRHVLPVAQRPPKAIAVVSAHYNSRAGITGVGAAAQPKMLYDYGGFPEESYHYQYPAPGNPALAEDIAQRICAAIGRPDAAIADPKRPFDHGVFVPLMKLFPEANIPVVSISVMEGDNATDHIAVGRALSALREAPHDVLFIGSGSSMHHFGRLFNGPDGSGTVFNNHLTKVLSAAEEENTKTKESRIEALKGILSFPGVEESHPKGQAEHLMPLLTIAGTAQGGAANEVTNINVMHGNMRQYVFFS